MSVKQTEYAASILFRLQGHLDDARRVIGIYAGVAALPFAYGAADRTFWNFPGDHILRDHAWALYATLLSCTSDSSGLIPKNRAGHGTVVFSDNVSIRSTPESEALGIGGRSGQVHGETTPSDSHVTVTGTLTADYAVAVKVPLCQIVSG